jgi:CBS domain-containing protein
MLTVSDLLQRKNGGLWTASPETPVADALRLMRDKDVGALPVLREGRLVGIFSERDYARHGPLDGRTDPSTPVAEFMTGSLYSCAPEDTLEHCMVLMTNKHIRHLPVVDAAGTLVGVISTRDVLKSIVDWQREHIEQLQLYQAGRRPSEHKEPA